MKFVLFLSSLGNISAVSKWVWDMLLADHEIYRLPFILTNRLGNGENKIENKGISKVKMNYHFFENMMARLMKKEERKTEGVVRR